MQSYSKLEEKVLPRANNTGRMAFPITEERQNEI